MIITFIGFKITFSNMGPKTTPSLISKGGVSDTPPLGGREIDTPWEIGLSSGNYLFGVSKIYIKKVILKQFIDDSFTFLMLMV